MRKALRSTWFYFTLALCIGIFFRMYLIAAVPAHPTLDEVTTGYNAYSILLTGKDEFSVPFPILLRAYDDWRPALYVYLVIPFVKIFGLWVFAVRAPSMVFSVISLVASYFLVLELFHQYKKRQLVAVIAMFLFAISPWAIYIGRLGHEANAGFTFFLLGLLFFLKFANGSRFRKVNISLLFSAVFFALSFDSYQSEKLVVPIVVIMLALLFFKKLIKEKLSSILAVALGIMIVLPLIYATVTTSDGLIRFAGTNLFRSSESPVEKSIARITRDRQNNYPLGIIFDNRRVGATILFSKAFFAHIDPVWLFLYKQGENFKIPDFGLINIIEFPFIVLGIFVIFRARNIAGSIKVVIIIWVCASIIPAAITTDYPHAMRVMTLLPVPEIMAALGVVVFIDRYHKKWMLGVLVASYIATTIWLFHAYFVNFRLEESYRFQYGVLESLKSAKNDKQGLKRVIVSNQGVLRASYMYYLFESKYNPALYQKNGGTVSGWFDQEHTIGNYSFVDISKKPLPGEALLIVPSGSVPEDNVTVLNRINFLDGKESIWIAVRR